MALSNIKVTSTLILDASLDRLWPLLSDTDRINRTLGLPATEKIAPDQDLVQVVNGHYLGVPVTWREYPFEWVFEQWYESTRGFESPFPIEQIVTSTRLNPLSDRQTRVEVDIVMLPRNVAGQLIAWTVVGRKMLSDLLRVYRLFGETAAAAANVAPPPPRKPTVNTNRLRVGIERLRQYSIRPMLIERLTSHLSTADDPDVLRMRPFALADQWGEPRMDVLRMFLYATRTGLLDLEWDILCPNCRGPSVRTMSLAELQRDAHCNSCNVRYDVNFDESVELRFNVNSDIREAIDMPFCIGGPANTRHILSQLWVPANSVREVRLRLPAGGYRLRSRQHSGYALLEASPTSEIRATRIGCLADHIVVEQDTIGAGEVFLSVENASNTNLLLILEQSAWSAQAVSAALVTSIAEFRELFSSQVLAPGIGVSIRNLTFLFSDLKGSTAMYNVIGDSPAYARVRDHFEMMVSIIGHYRGALVKTIGDAVMAVFTSVEDAVHASLEIQREFIFGEIGQGNPALQVKLGLHRGPCIAVNANDLLDYFGSTVNIAARVQNESLGGDIVITTEVMGDPGVVRLLEQEQPRIESFQQSLKGFTQSFTLYRLWVTNNRVKEPAQQQEQSIEVQ